ncbi:hypothetical protein CFP65_7595 [Kitasatospora sp. MMS16-BH015]|uniref:hypothetical protein n=1 Tax=Kitasatospora sp. MMS16-BH015 TaxID=2018025 RepID=UPI000CA0904E|nr:hypothetical protein [Kitasatospora sp. MMS16-BH015]AUG82166.1 hypothetical protein CFP65_7595 [Kitasatospora sp. MMS16-BH015]
MTTTRSRGGGVRRPESARSSGRLWRRHAYALLSLPVGLAAIPMALAGRSTAVRQRRFVLAMLGLPVGRASHLPRRVLSHGLLSTPLNLVATGVTACGWSIVLTEVSRLLRPVLRDPELPRPPATQQVQPPALHFATGLAALLTTVLAAQAITALQRQLARHLLLSPAEVGRTASRKGPPSEDRSP